MSVLLIRIAFASDLTFLKYFWTSLEVFLERISFLNVSKILSSPGPRPLDGGEASGIFPSDPSPSAPPASPFDFSGHDLVQGHFGLLFFLLFLVSLFGCRTEIFRPVYHTLPDGGQDSLEFRDFFRCRGIEYMTQVGFKLDLVDPHGIKLLEHLLTEPRDVGFLDVLLYGLPRLIDHHIDEPARDHIEDAVPGKERAMPVRELPKVPLVDLDPFRDARLAHFPLDELLEARRRRRMEVGFEIGDGDLDGTGVAFVVDDLPIDVEIPNTRAISVASFIEPPKISLFARG
jgi:hypothetical protein